MKRITKLLCIIVIISVLVSSIPIIISANNNYVDVPSSHWAYYAIYAVTENGVLLSNSNSYFYPNQYVTRAEAVKALYNFIYAMPRTNVTTPFTDVPVAYATYIEWAYDIGITSGTTTTTFSPNNNITKQDMCLLIAELYSVHNITFSKNRNYSSSPFNDDSDISSWAKDAVVALYNHNIINGDTHGNFNPRSNITRAMLAVMLKQLYEYIYFVSVTPVAQKSGFDWCWAACATMVGSYGVSYPPMAQELVVRYIKGYEFNDRGSNEEIKYGAEYASQNTKNFQVITDPTLCTMGQIWLRLKGNNPMITTGQLLNNPNYGHAVVILGYSYTDTQQYVIYCDPMTGTIERETFTRFKNGAATGNLWEDTIRK
ncbi:MAG: S-layer homology domain-containing protein [Clostridia bacterium]|nr:S-layer homology domain-containing protein [Clostridia bacterium]